MTYQFMKQEEEKVRLYLDDVRSPEQAALYCKPELVPMYNKEKWEIVRNYHEFVAWIEKNGLPDIVSFDHDLAPEHYAPPEHWDGKYEEWVMSQDMKEKTGYHCAVWLCDYCMGHDLPLPEYYIHSANPVGAENIESYLNQFKVLQNDKI